MRFKLKVSTVLCFLMLVCTITVSSVAQTTQIVSSKLYFSENENVIPLEERSRRKFDNAVIADLDQDGYLDLLLMEHSRRVELFWNIKGIFKKGEPFIFGDTHGIAIADYNQDGKIGLVVQPGGGDGKNPRKLKSFQVNRDRTIDDTGDFLHFEASRGRAAKFIDVDNNGSLDLITTAFPKMEALSHGNRLYKSDEDVRFKFVEYMPHADRMGMRSTLTDFNNDHKTDVLFYGGNGIVTVEGKNDMVFTDVSKDVLGDISNLNLVNSISEIDFDNDGDFDLFLTRSKHPFDSESNYDEENKTFYFFARRTAFEFDNLKVDGDLVIENLQMAFPNFDVFIGENKRLFKRKEDQHGHHDLTLTQNEAKGWPKNTSKKALYIGYLGNNLWRVAGHTNSPTSAVLHNVISKPEAIELKQLPAKLLENRGGKFVDVTKAYGINVPEQTTSAAIGDFNNDGWSDIFILRYGNPSKQTEQILYLNNEGKQFVQSKSHGIVTKELGATGMGADAFDYDKDGDLDIVYSNERGRWHLFTNNNQSNNNYLEINVGNSPSGKATAMGAVLTITACGNKYKRVVGATSSSYSQSYNTYLHVGLGQCKQIEKAEVTWSNGEKVTLNIEKLNVIQQAGRVIK